MPIMPMLPANEIISVRAFFVKRLFVESESAVSADIEVFLYLPFELFFFFAAVSSGREALYGFVSSTISPSRRRTVRVE